MGIFKLCGRGGLSGSNVMHIGAGVGLEIGVGSGVAYDMRDEFTDTVAAGSVNGTLATDGVSVRTTADTNLKLSLSGGACRVEAGGVGYGNPALWYPGRARTPGKMIINAVNVTTLAEGASWGWDVNQASLPASSNAFFLNAGFALTAFDSSVGIELGAIAIGMDYAYTIPLRSLGAFYLIKGGAYTNWTLLYVSQLINTATVYPCIMGKTATVFAANYIRVPTPTWLPTPLASDGFASSFSATDGKGHAEGVAGGIGAGGGGLAWTPQLGTWGVSGGKAVASVLDVPTSMALATVDVGTINAIVACDLVRAGDAVGVVTRYVDANNYIRASHDGTNAMLIKRMAGTDTTVVTAAATYAANARIEIVSSGTAFRLLYNKALIGTGTIADAVLQTSTLAGIRTTNTGNTFDNFVVWARGNEGQYATLDQYINP